MLKRLKQMIGTSKGKYSTFGFIKTYTATKDTQQIKGTVVPTEAGFQITIIDSKLDKPLEFNKGFDTKFIGDQINELRRQGFKVIYTEGKFIDFLKEDQVAIIYKNYGKVLQARS